MADLNADQQRYAELLKQANEELQRNGELSLSTQSRLRDQQVASATGLKSFTQATELAQGALGSFATAGTQAGKAMLDGKKGATAFNDSIDSMTTAVATLGAALSLLIPVIGPLVAGFVLATRAVVEYGKEANKMGQNLHKSYQDLARSGGAAASGMTGIKNDALKLGLSMNDLDQMVSLVADNSKDLALFAGSVSEGRRGLVDMVDGMGSAKDGLMNMGLSMKDINEGTAGYLRLQTRLGRSQTMTTDQLAAGAAKYLREQDALTQLTGQTRKEMEDQRERALQGEQFAATIRELRLKGDDKAADNLLKLNAVYEAAGPKMAAGFQASVTGNLANKDAQELNLASNGEVIRTTQAVIAGQMDFTKAAEIAGKAIGNTADTVGVQLGKLNAYNSNFGDLAQQLKFAQLTGKDFGETLDKINKDQDKRKAGADGLVAQQTDLFKAQQAATVATTEFVFKGIKPATDAMDMLARKTEAGAKALDELTPGGRTTTKETVEDVGQAGGAIAGGLAGAAIGSIVPVLGTAIGAIVGSLIGTWGGGTLGKMGAGKAYDAISGPTAEQSNAPPRAEGGPVDAGKLYKVGERGQEYFKPKTAGDIIPNDVATGLIADKTKMGQLYKEMLKDTDALEKITDTDLTRTKEFSKINKTLMDKKIKLMNEEIELLDEQKAAIDKMADLIEKNIGKEASEAYRKTSIGIRASGGGTGGGSGLQMPSPGGGTGGGSGLQMPKASNAPSMGGGQGLQIGKQDDLKKLGLNIKEGDVQAEGAKISPNLIELAKAIQSGVPGFSYFSSFNDKFHQEKAPTSKHAEGLAADFTVAQKPDVETGKNITDWLKSMGASLAIDEYNSPTAKATGGHFHVQIPAFEEGGNLGAGKVGIAGENGKPELITGPATITPMNDLVGTFNTMVGLMGQQVSMLDEMIRAQKNGNDISSKILRVQT